MKKLIALVSSVTLLFVLATSVSAAAPEDLVGWWKMDTAIDSSDNANNATPTDVTFDSEAGLFNGTTSKFVVTDSNSLDIVDEITIEAKFKPTAVNGYRTLVSKRNGSVSNYTLRIWDGKLEFYYRSPGDTQWSEWSTASSVVSVDADNWHTAVVAYKWSDNSITMYYDGSEVNGSWIYGVSDTEVASNTHDLHIGYNYTGSAQAFQGYIDDVRIWKTALSFPYGLIIKPSLNEVVFGSVSLEAFYNDGDAIDDDAVNWAVRYNSCAAATNTRFGNVDGKTDLYAWNGSSFHATINTDAVDSGYYCFVFNPTDDGPVDVRESRLFYIGHLGSIDPLIDYNPVGTTHTVSTNIGVNIAGVEVFFSVSGANTAGGAIETNSDGLAQFTYTGVYPGTDNITACIDLDEESDCDESEPSAGLATKYWFDNYITGGGTIKDDRNPRWTFAGVVGRFGGADIIGNFQYIDHAQKNKCKFDSFDSLVFSGSPAVSPEAYQSIATITGMVTCSVDGTLSQKTIVIEDVGEPGGGQDRITFDGGEPLTLSGGNLQVHNVE